jgi:hypothetical protein
MKDNTINMPRRGFLASVAAFLGVGAAAKSGRTAAKGFPSGVQPLPNDVPHQGTIVSGQAQVSGPCPRCCEAAVQVTAFVLIEVCKVGDTGVRVKQAGPVRLICEPCGCDISNVDVSHKYQETQCT